MKSITTSHNGDEYKCMAGSRKKQQCGRSQTRDNTGNNKGISKSRDKKHQMSLFS